jgi:hypothetical protein
MVFNRSRRRSILFGVFFILLALFVYDYITFKIQKGRVIKSLSCENLFLRAKIEEIEKGIYLATLRDREIETRLIWGDIYTHEEEFSHKKRIEGVSEEYSIYIDEEKAPISGYIEIVNRGDTLMRDVRIFINGQTFYKTSKEIIDSIIKEGMTDKEKTFAIWNFIRNRRYHWWPGEEFGQEIHNPVKFINVYGYGFCHNVAGNFVALCKTAGLLSRICELGGHCVAEVFYDNSWHLFDPDSEAFYLDDNGKVASLSELENEPSLVLRTHHPNTIYEKQKRYIASIYSSKDNYYRPPYRIPIHGMEINLRPGESFVHTWKAFDGIDIRRREYYPEIQTDIKWWPDEESPLFHTRYYTNKPPWSNMGLFKFKPKLKEDRLKILFEEYSNLYVGKEDGFISNNDKTQPGSFLIGNRYPFVIVGGKIIGEFLPSSEEDYLRVSIVKGEKEVKRLEVRGITKKRRIYLNLNDLFNRRDSESILYPEACYEYFVKVLIFCKKRGRYGLRDLELHTQCQITPFSPWILKPGINRIRFTTKEEGKVEGEIIHVWRTNEYPQRFKQYPLPIFPKALVKKENLHFCWRPTKDSKGRFPHSYYLIVSPREDFLWPISPGCEVNLSGETTEWVPPKAFFRKGHTYYWRICAKDIFGHKSEYSPTMKFTIDSKGQ